MTIYCGLSIKCPRCGNMSECYLERGHSSETCETTCTANFIVTTFVTPVTPYADIKSGCGATVRHTWASPDEERYARH